MQNQLRYTLTLVFSLLYKGFLIRHSANKGKSLSLNHSIIQSHNPNQTFSYPSFDGRRKVFIILTYYITKL